MDKYYHVCLMSAFAVVITRDLKRTNASQVHGRVVGILGPYDAEGLLEFHTSGAVGQLRGLAPDAWLALHNEVERFIADPDKWELVVKPHLGRV